MEDRHLLQRFVRDNSQEAFAALTARYLNLVYSVCRRELDSAEAAEDVTQAVFLILARKAPRLGRSVVLSGWLFQTARFAAKNARLQAQRRAAYEHKAAEAVMETQTEEAQWAEIEPLLNQSLSGLKETERDCVLLRFFQGLSFAEVGASLGLSEEAARKRVARSLDKMRLFFTKNGVIIPSIVLTGLLTARAAKAAPVACQADIAHLSHTVIAGHLTAVLTGSHAYQLLQGTLNAMKIAQIKIAVALATVLVVGVTATYGVVRSAAAPGKPLPPIKIAREPIPHSSAAQAALLKKLGTDSVFSEYRTVSLTGRVRLENGTSAGRVHLCAQAQASEMDKIFSTNPQSPTSGKPRAATDREMEISGSFAHTRSDGSYTLFVGPGIKYNIFVVGEDLTELADPDTGLVAAAAEGISGGNGATVAVPDIILTPGGIITGTVTDEATGRPVQGATVMSYGPHRPNSSAAVIGTQTDSTGTYRLRVAPGKSRVYEADQFNPQRGPENNYYLEVAEGETKTQDFQITLK